MKKLIIIIILILAPAWAWGLDNRAIRSGALPITSGFSSATLGAYTDGNPNIFVIDTLTLDSAIDDETRGSLAVKTGGLKQFLEWDQDNKIALFEVSGDIDGGGALFLLANDNIEIMGQSAPSPGIAFKNMTIRTQGCDNFVIQHVELKGSCDVASTGSEDIIMIGWQDSDCDPDHTEPYVCEDRAEYSIVDHCALAWSNDELLISDNADYIIASNNILAQALPIDSAYSHGPAFKDSQSVLFYRNLSAHNDDRNPYVVYGSTVAITNNWVYNPQTFPIDAQGEYHIAADSNIVQAGPTSNNSVIDPYWFAFIGDPNVASEVYFVGNVSDDNPQANEDDYTGVRETGATTYDNEGGDNGDFETDFKAANAAAVIDDGITAVTADGDLKQDIITNVGAWPNARTTFATEMVADARDGEGSRQTVKPSFAGYAIAENSRDLATGMGVFGAIPNSVSTDSDSDGRSDFREWLDALTIYVETGANPPGEDTGASREGISESGIGHY